MAKDGAKTDGKKGSKPRRNVAVDGMDLDSAKSFLAKLTGDAAVCAVMKKSEQYEKVAQMAKTLRDELAKCS